MVSDCKLTKWLRLQSLAASLLMCMAGNPAGAHCLSSVRAVEQPVPLATSITDPDLIFVGLHGFGLDKSSYKSFSGKVEALGIPFYGIDVRGFGDHAGEEVNFEETATDVQKALYTLKAEHTRSRIILIGESMGGALAVKVAASHPELVDAVISSEPAYKLTLNPIVYPYVLWNLVVRPTAPLRVATDFANRVSKNSDLVSRIKTRLATERGFSAQELWRFRQLMKSTEKSVSQLRDVPILFLQGDCDRLCRPAGTTALFKMVPEESRRLVMLKGRGHLLLEEGQADSEVMNSVMNWVYQSRLLQAKLVSANSR